MKKTIKKLSLGKTTISNLDSSVMNQQVGGALVITVVCPTKLTCTYSHKPTCPVSGCGCHG